MRLKRDLFAQKTTGHLARTIALLGALLAFAGGSVSAAPLEILGPPTSVFVAARDACDPTDYPDAPARAIRRADGTVVLIASHFTNRAMTGASLRALKPDCAVVFAAGNDPDPAAYSDRGWIASLWTEDGTTVQAIVHHEYQGHLRPERCPPALFPERRYMACWWNSLTAAVSTDGGRQFVPVGPPPSLVAALPYRAETLRGRHAGYFNPSNMVRLGSRVAFLVHAEQRGAQARGHCLIATETPGRPDSWRAWDGQNFTIRFADPYRETIEPSRHVCAVVGRPGLDWPVTALLWHAPAQRFVALMLGGPHRPEHLSPTPGIYLSTSRDLVSWTPPRFLLPAIGHGAFRCGGEQPIAYPALLDPDSLDPSFATITGETALLFYTRFNVPRCRIDGDRDLVALPVRLDPR